MLQIQHSVSPWADAIQPCASRKDNSVLTSALQTSIPGVVRPGAQGQAGELAMDSQVHFPLVDLYDADFATEKNSAYMTRLWTSDDGRSSGDGYCAFFYGPSIALLRRCEAHLYSPDWLSASRGPHPTSHINQLFDLALKLPAIFNEVDRLLASPATTARRMELQDGLRECLALEGHFSQWLSELAMGSADGRAFWVDHMDGGLGESPLENPFTFRDLQTGLMMMYFWMSQILSHRCIESVRAAIFQPVIDAYPDMWLVLQSALQIDIGLYQNCRELAANICRGLDAVLGMKVQPDTLVAPMMVVTDFYNELDALSQDCLLGSM
ncbi:hypothetical protein MAC_00624 [Metarhizium acridum CQMa 102]|uniref:C6 finger domain protein n=1 Tax=Metarhizium acridum (strain CQMa 102) TaxID=655827 RepID=E9DSM6_METAQ|nr:uncharacterized protein MAC_00624 [Metarhizium acridum CQMa 102]EFY93386.1 hypothetical protein MAC_00624 [Metarhizium acridum CQMa 102]